MFVRDGEGNGGGQVDEKRRDNWSVQADGDVYKWASSSCLLVLSCAAVEVAALLFVAPPSGCRNHSNQRDNLMRLQDETASPHQSINHPSYQMNFCHKAEKERKKEKKNLKMQNRTSL